MLLRSYHRNLPRMAIYINIYIFLNVIFISLLLHLMMCDASSGYSIRYSSYKQLFTQLIYLLALL